LFWFDELPLFRLPSLLVDDDGVIPLQPFVGRLVSFQRVYIIYQTLAGSAFFRLAAGHWLAGPHCIYCLRATPSAVVYCLLVGLSLRFVGGLTLLVVRFRTPVSVERLPIRFVELLCRLFVSLLFITVIYSVCPIEPRCRAV
jgi:hypothetical protein